MKDHLLFELAVVLLVTVPASLLAAGASYCIVLDTVRYAIGMTRETAPHRIACLSSVLVAIYVSYRLSGAMIANKK